MRRRRERGAVAIETALILPIIILVLFGIVDYGLLFSNSLAVRQGVREAARATVVLVPEDATNGVLPNGCGLLSGDLGNVNCVTNAEIDPIAGDSFASAKITTPEGLDTNEWVVGNYLVVCAVVRTAGLTGLVPLPTGGEVSSRIVMRIENGKGYINGESEVVNLAPDADVGVTWGGDCA
jgi:Flp pilus assembly protein TadG